MTEHRSVQNASSRAGRGQLDRWAGEDDTTGLLRQWSQGCARSGERALERLYPDLARLTASRAAAWALGVSPSDLLQEVAVRIAKQDRTHWRDRSHFFAIAARLVRRVLVDEARRQSRDKRRPDEAPAGRAAADGGAEPIRSELLDLARALERLRRIDATAAHLVDLRYFAGLSMTETAAALGISTSTAVRRWRFARAWLSTQLAEHRDGR